MRKLYLLVLFYINFSSVSFAQSPRWQWAREGNGDESLNWFWMSTTPDGSSYGMAEYTGGLLTFGHDTLASSPHENSLFVVKYDPQGNVRWLRGAWTPESPGAYFWPKGIGADNFGNAYIAGEFGDSVIAFGNDTLRGNSNFFVVKYDSSGNVVWAKTPVTPGWGTAVSGMWVDANGNSYVVGEYSHTVIFGNDTLINPGSNYVAFVVEFDPRGQVKWLRDIRNSTPTSNTSSLYSVTTDVAGNIYLLGQFAKDTLLFGNDTLYNPTSANNFFIVKYDSSYTVQWAKCSSGNQIGGGNTSLTVSSRGDVFASGIYERKIIFGTDSITNPDTLNFYTFIVKLDSTGAVKWLKATMDSMVVNDVKADAQSNLYACGYYYGQKMVFGADTLKGRESGKKYSFAGEYDTDGNPLWALGTTGIDAIPWGLENTSQAEGLGLDANDNVYIMGFTTYNYLIFGNDSLLQISHDYEIPYMAKIARCILPVAPVNTSASNALCSGSSIILTAGSGGTGILSWYSADSGGVYLGPGSSYTTPPLSSSITYYVQDSACGGAVRTLVAVNVNPKPQAVITLAGYDSLTTGNFTHYQWLMDGTVIANANTRLYIAAVNGNYQVAVTDSNGCTDTSAVYSLQVLGNSPVGGMESFHVYPNPGSGAFVLETENSEGGIFSVCDAMGNVIITQVITSAKQQVDLTQAPAGIYHLRITALNGQYAGSFVIVK